MRKLNHHLFIVIALVTAMTATSGMSAVSAQEDEPQSTVGDVLVLTTD